MKGYEFLIREKRSVTSGRELDELSRQKPYNPNRTGSREKNLLGQIILMIRDPAYEREEEQCRQVMIFSGF